MDSQEGLYSEDGPAQETDSKSREETLHSLHTLHLQVNRMEEVLLAVQSSISSQSGMLAEIREAQVTSQKASAAPAGPAGSASAPQSSRSILKKQVRTEEEVEFILTPPDSPQKLPILPGEVKEVRVKTSTGDNKRQRSSSRRGQAQRDREARRDAGSSSTFHAGTLDELSNIFARGLLISHSSNSSPPGTAKSLNPAIDSKIPEKSEQDSQSAQSGQSGERSDSQKSHKAVLEKTGRLSLDELRTQHNAQALAATASRTMSAVLETRGGMPCAAELWMILTGILRCSSARLSRLWGLSLLSMGLAIIGVLLWFGHTEPVDGATIATTISYIFGVACSTWILRSDEVQELVGAQKGHLDMYARNRGFIREWRRKSIARFSESIGFLIIMCASRCLGYSQGLLLLPVFPNVAFCIAASGFAATAYMQLHILSGLELSIDSFSINLFRTMQIPDAIEEWNVVQATLRHVSIKLSKSLLVLGSCCCGASLVHLIDLSFLRSDVETGLPLILTNLWLLPPIMCFLYTLARAASVTEKASRVSPLVNSWTFESQEQPEDVPKWMDPGRQYLVQYMMQSEAGFYMQGVRLRIFQVTKMCYYLGAVLFAVGARIFE